MTHATDTPPPRDDPPPADAVLGALSGRCSVGPKHLIAPAPSEAEWARAVALALRAPDHGHLRPFRFVHIAPEQRAALGELFAEGARQRGLGGDEVERARARAHNGPGLLALVGRLRDDLPEVPPREQLLSAGAGLMNLLNALHLMGYAAKVLSGASVDDPPVRQAFCGEGETLLCWVVCGTASERPRHRGVDPATALTSWRDEDRP